jgi:DNA-binding beta-propeller fold protein YncE
MRLADGIFTAAVSSLVVTLAGCQTTTTANTPPTTSVVAQSRPRSCNIPSDSAIVKIQVPGRPFEAIATEDGCWIFASLIGGSAVKSSPSIKPGIAVLQRSGGRIRLVRTLALIPPIPGGIAVTHDGRLMVVADGPVVSFIDVERLLSAGASPILGSIRSGEDAGSIYLTVTADDAVLFVSDERMRQVTVIDLSKARRTGFQQNSIIGRIPVGIAPVGLALSKDQKHLFITSEIWVGTSGWPTSCSPEGSDKARPRPEGAVSVVDVDRARVQPSESVIGVIAAGCSPVRAVLSPDSQRLYVSARGSNSLLIFDTSRLIGDVAHAQPFTVPVGTAPVGVEVINDGREVVVANSNRFGGSGGSNLSVVDASKADQGASAVEGTVPTGLFARELHATADGKALLLTDFDSGQIEVIRLDSLRSKLEGPP